MAGVFAAAQPKYAALGIAKFPFDATEQVKRGPLVSHYSRMGLPASRQMALRFPDAPGLAAMAGARNRFTIVDIDEKGAAGERLLADVQRQFGHSKVVVRTGSGGFHCYYLHDGEVRKIRLDPRKPIDLIGGGPIVLPPSRGLRGRLETGVETFWGHVARQAHLVRSLHELIAVAREMNELMAEPWSDTEVHSEIVKRCKYWWDKTQKGENWFGIGRYVRATHAELDSMLTNPSAQDALLLLTFLRRHHWGRDFYLANATRESLGWTLRRFVAARRLLIEMKQLVVIRPQTPKRPMQCRLRVSDSAHQ
jgi:hypothetical protein